MRYRRLTRDGDMQFGRSAGDFYVDQPEAVAQACVTRLRLWTGDWFLDLAEGTDWQNSVLGTGTQGLYDAELRDRIAGTQGLTSIESYRSVRDRERRALAVAVTIGTAYGQITFAAPTVVTAPPTPPGLLLTGLLSADAQALLGADGVELAAGADPSLPLTYI